MTTEEKDLARRMSVAPNDDRMCAPDTVISVEHLGKRYRLGTLGYRTFRDALVSASTRPLRHLRRRQNGAGQEEATHVWAVRDVSFDVASGEVIGVIGRNGSGKSTLLKLLARITAPTEGKAHIRGRIGSLLEVGTGFHQELSGRENVYLSGAILGMRRSEIAARFDDIVTFAEVERFIDTPVKRYSSGMYVRLAFAVAAHLDTDILLVDEVLAVGDAAFQQKCLGAMGQMHSLGRTVFFVSHNLASVEKLCQRAIWMDAGRLRMLGPTREVIQAYLRESLALEGTVDLTGVAGRSGTGTVRLNALELTDVFGRPRPVVPMGERIRVRLSYRSISRRGNVAVGFYLLADNGQLVADFRSNHGGLDLDVTPGQEYTLEVEIGPVYLYPRTYFLSPWVTDGAIREDLDYLTHAARFTVQNSDFLGSLSEFSEEHGITHIPSAWRSL